MAVLPRPAHERHSPFACNAPRQQLASSTLDLGTPYLVPPSLCLAPH